jgi:predicted dehydrogenase
MAIAIIGTGRQSPNLGKRFMDLGSIRMVAACDVYQAKLDLFAKMVEETYAAQAGGSNWKGFKTYTDYSEIINRSDIDGVIIATPDHWHAKPAIEAASAGKHVYCEKPVSHTVREGRAMVDAAKKNKITFQTGSMQRSSEGFLHACELVRNGYLGDIKKVIVSVGDPAIPCDLPAMTQPEGLLWDKWLGGAEVRPFHTMLAPAPGDQGWPQWRQFREFGGGILSDWGAHMYDIAQWALGKDHTGPVELMPPKEAGATRGLVMRYDDGIELVHADFGRGWGCEFHGTDGVLQVSRQYLDTEPANIASIQMKAGDTRLYKSENHYQNWIDCIKSGEQPICDAETGHRSATLCNIANIAYWTGKDLRWDPVKEKFDDKEANKHLSKQYRKGYGVKV